MWLLGRSLLENPPLELKILQDSEATGFWFFVRRNPPHPDPPHPPLKKSHNGLRSPHRSVLVHRGMGGTSRRHRGGETLATGRLTPACRLTGHCSGDADEPAAVCTRWAAIVIQMS